ncbi:MAG: DNA polymerase III subunit gamma/tau [Pyrinomonadaceae bacterium MAG19_C2-C3]|nr:DNA polymerase III subunit gamma/tau [Pyrinomonadaceae bacterium MAG19_C2-C3]
MYQVIARKWRPQTFEEVTGQEAITRTLTNAIVYERLHHAYMFSGARGVGKTTTARLLAKALNCHKTTKPNPLPCRIDDETACVSCREIAESRSIDVLEIDAASNTGVDNVRDQIINTVAIRPARDRYRVFIIDEVHMLSGAAFNALLKTLEEPPSNVVFIMATTELHKLPDTILSRCQQFEFRIIALPKITARLKLIADAENVDIEDAALSEIARAGEGSMRDAQSAFDQVISFSQGHITAAEVETALGLAGTELLLRTLRAIADAQPSGILKVVDDLVMRGHDLRNFCRELLAQFRDLLVLKVGVGSDEDDADATRAQAFAEMRALSEQFTESDLVRFFHSLTQTERDIRESAHPRYQLELGLIKLIEMRRLAGIDDLIARLQSLEENLRGEAKPVRVPPSSQGGASNAPPSGGTGNNTPPRTGTSAFAPPPTIEEKSAFAHTLPSAAQNPSSAPAASSTRETTVAPFVAPDAKPLKESLENVPPASVNPPNLSAPSLKLVTPPSSPPARDAVHTNIFDLASASHASAVDEAPSSTATVQLDTPIERIKQELEARRRTFVVVALDEAASVYLEDDELVVEYLPKHRHLRDNLTRPESRKVLGEVCRDVLGRDTGLRVRIKDEDERATPAATPRTTLSQVPSRDDAVASLMSPSASDEEKELWRRAEADPNVQQILKTFRGQIISVRRVEPEAQTDSASS